MAEFVCLKCGHRFEARKEEAQRRCSKCWSNAIMRADEYDPLVEELSQRLREEMEKGLTDPLTDLIRLLNLFATFFNKVGFRLDPLTTLALMSKIVERARKGQRG
jgi:DNA-directed RNA polymerase subunit RPC12/RpoP